MARVIFKRAAEKFSRQIMDYDAGVAEGGLAEGAARLLPCLVERVVVEGAERIPLNGPVLFVSNHPGLSDTLALFSAIPRADLKVLAASREFLEMLEATSRKLITVPEGGEGRMDAVRAAAGHLRSGGAVLTFPAGKIEPDPAVMPGALESLADWNVSTGLFVRLVPGLVIVPVIVSGVIARQAVFHPLTRLRRSQKDREMLGASLQLIMNELFPALWPVTVWVRFADPINGTALIGLHDPTLITAAVVEKVKPLLLAVEPAGMGQASPSARVS